MVADLINFFRAVQGTNRERPFYILYLDNKVAGSCYLALTVFIGSEPVRKPNRVFLSSRKGYKYYNYSMITTYNYIYQLSYFIDTTL